jgi:hypothetical protein
MGPQEKHCFLKKLRIRGCFRKYNPSFPSQVIEKEHLKLQVPVMLLGQAVAWTNRVIYPLGFNVGNNFTVIRLFPWDLM